MASLGIDGLSSGLDTTAIISSLMQIEAAPQTLLKSKRAASQDIVSALQAINTKLRSLSESAAKASAASNWSSHSATSSSTAATATASSGAAAATLTFSVDAVATAQMSLSDLIPEGGSLVSDPPTLTLRSADGTVTTVSPASGSPADVAKAVNNAGAGVTATVVRVPSGGGTQMRVQFTSQTRTSAPSKRPCSISSSRMHDADNAPMASVLSTDRPVVCASAFAPRPLSASKSMPSKRSGRS